MKTVACRCSQHSFRKRACVIKFLKCSIISSSVRGQPKNHYLVSVNMYMKVRCSLAESTFGKSNLSVETSTVTILTQQLDHSEAQRCHFDNHTWPESKKEKERERPHHSFQRNNSVAGAANRLTCRYVFGLALAFHFCSNSAVRWAKISLVQKSACVLFPGGSKCSILG